MVRYWVICPRVFVSMLSLHASQQKPMRMKTSHVWCTLSLIRVCTFSNIGRLSAWIDLLPVGHPAEDFITVYNYLITILLLDSARNGYSFHAVPSGVLLRLTRSRSPHAHNASLFFTVTCRLRVFPTLAAVA